MWHESIAGCGERQNSMAHQHTFHWKMFMTENPVAFFGRLDGMDLRGLRWKRGIQIGGSRSECETQHPPLIQYSVFRTNISGGLWKGVGGAALFFCERALFRNAFPQYRVIVAPSAVLHTHTIHHQQRLTICTCYSVLVEPSNRPLHTLSLTITKTAKKLKRCGVHRAVLHRLLNKRRQMSPKIFNLNYALVSSIMIPFCRK